MEKTLVLIKPDGVQRRLCGEIIGRFERKGLRVVAAKFVRPARELASLHYAVHAGKSFYEELLKFLTSGPTFAMVLEGREAVSAVRAMMGPTDGAKAPPGTIRGDYGLSIQNNLVHGSDSVENAAKEISLWFQPDELVDWTPSDAAVVG
jgi:nucleoside-diphosphate kinase